MIAARRLLLFPLLALACVVDAATAKPAAARSSYTGAIVMEADTGRILFEDSADTVNPPASMTKLMTFAVLHDKLADGSLKLDTMVTVSHDEAKFAMKSDSTAVWLKEKETFPVEELVYAMMIQSANDAALVLSRVAAGSPEAFVELMNAKARALGMNHTTFRTPHGLTKGRVEPGTTDLTTPRDYAVLARYLVHETDVLKYTSIKTRPFGQRTPPTVMNNHNHLLGKFTGLDGLKTGYTGGAGFCLAATAERNGRRIIAVVMGSPDSKSRDLKVMELLERGFATAPAALPKVKTDGPAPTAAAPADTIPTIKTDKTASAPPAPAAKPASTAAEPMFNFHVTPPPTKKP